MTTTEAPANRPAAKRMPFERPDGGWTVRGGLPTGDISYDDSTDPEFFRDEMEAVFRRSWLHVGRTIQIPEPGDYFTRELPGLGASVIICRGRDGEVRAFHNMCTHRGNKLLWEDHPDKELCGNAKRFVCKYHGWQFDPEGTLRYVKLEDWFFDIDKGDYGLVPVSCDIWGGFIFINLDPNPSETLAEQIAPFGDGLAGYPFDKLTHSYTFACEAKANWKIFLDAMVEQYHGNTLHHKLVDPASKGPLRGAIGSHFEVYDRNAIWSVAVPVGSDKPRRRPERPTADIFRSNLWGPRDHPDIGLTTKPPLLNLTDNPLWTNDMFCIFPNFNMLVWNRGWIMVYSTWPIAVDRVLFESRMYFQPPRNASDRLAQELTAVEFKEFLLQDANLLECAQARLNYGARDHFPLSDEEVLVRNLHQRSREAVDAYRAERVEAGGR